ncbi:MAG: 30S ribosomal protein S2 [Acidimicrobiia bacterium]|nr:30S ribosomal protein S2 [Acidimicrobiia bacterium]
MSTVTMKQLLEAGVHFGHQTRRWNPKMSPYLFGERNGIHIVDLRQTLTQLQDAYKSLEDIVARGGTVLFVGTKKQAQHIMAGAAEEAGMPYITNRWLGGMLTNFKTSHKRILYMKELERMDDSGEMDALPKKERIRLRREKAKLVNNLGGVRDLNRPPDALFIIDILTEHIAVKEATRLGIPIVALVDTNCDPDPIDIVIPGNDDAIRSAQLFADSLAQACIAGRARFESKAQAAAEGDDTPEPAEEAPAAEAAPASPPPAAPAEPDSPAPSDAAADAATPPPAQAAEPAEAATAPEAPPASSETPAATGESVEKETVGD